MSFNGLLKRKVNRQSMEISAGKCYYSQIKWTATPPSQTGYQPHKIKALVPVTTLPST